MASFRNTEQIRKNENFVRVLILQHVYYCLQEYEPIYLANYQARTSGERLHQGRRIYGYLENFAVQEIHH